MDDTAGRPDAAFVHGNSDTGGAVRAIESITTGTGWKRVRDPVEVVGDPSRANLDACWELGAMVAASLTLDEPRMFAEGRAHLDLVDRQDSDASLVVPRPHRVEPPVPNRVCRS
jgi:hypothetical protein